MLVNAQISAVWPMRGRLSDRLSGLKSLKADPNTYLTRKRNADRRAWTEEIAQPPGGHSQLVQAGNRLRLGASSVEAKCGGVG